MNKLSLLSPEGKDFLDEQYNKKERSTYSIADELGTYPNKIRRALVFHGYELRDKSNAQKKALKSGRHKHPTKDTKRPISTKNKIGNQMSNSWASLSIEEKEERSKKAKEFWEKIPKNKKEQMRSEAAKAIRRAAIEGSELEKHLMIYLLVEKFKVEFHKEFLTTKETTHVDIYLPELNTVIEIDGPSHFIPIWGQENLDKIQKTDAAKTGLLLEKGMVVIRIKHLVKNISEVYKRRLAIKIKDILYSIKAKYPEENQRLIIVEA